MCGLQVNGWLSPDSLARIAHKGSKTDESIFEPATATTTTATATANPAMQRSGNNPDGNGRGGQPQTIPSVVNGKSYLTFAHTRKADNI
jgi:hypothetical protein